MKKTIAFFSFLLMFGTLFSNPLFGRDWEKYPASVEIPRAERVAVIGDIHGAFEQYAKTLNCLGVIAPVASGSFKVQWTGGKTVLICMGDYGDRGEHSKEVYDALMDLEEQAPKSGGRVVTILGNHEIYLISGIVEDRARNDRAYEAPRTAINTVRSFENGGINFYKAISREGKYGAWIRNLPLYAIVNDILFIHGGPSYNFSSPKKMLKAFKKAMDTESYLYTKGIFFRTYGPLMTRDWWVLTDKNYVKDDDFAFQQLKKWKVNAIVFGHTPSALSARGFIGSKFQKFISVDVGMTPYYRHNEQGGGLLMNITPTGKLDFLAKYPNKPEQFMFSHDIDKSNPARKPVSDLTSTSARVNVGIAQNNAEVRLTVSDFKNSFSRTDSLKTTEASKVASFKLDNLEPDTRYFYRVEVNGDYEPGLKGSFKTPLQEKK